MSDKQEQTLRDFQQRPSEEQADLLHHTWCNQCQEVDLGMVNPQEYEFLGRIFLEGECVRCGAVSTTEIVEEDDEGGLE